MLSKALAAGAAGLGQLVRPELGTEQDIKLQTLMGALELDPLCTPRPGQSPPCALLEQLFEELKPSCQSSSKQMSYL